MDLKNHKRRIHKKYQVKAAKRVSTIFICQYCHNGNSSSGAKRICEYRCKKKEDEDQEENEADKVSKVSDPDKQDVPGKSKFRQCQKGAKQRVKDRVDKKIAKSPVVIALKKSALQTDKKRQDDDVRQRNLEKKRSNAAPKRLLK